MSEKLMKLNPLFIAGLFLSIIFLVMFYSIYSSEKKTIAQHQLSSSILTMNSISYSIKSEFQSTIVESLRISNFAEDRRYDQADNNRFEFLYSVIMYKMREVLDRKPEVGRISLYRNGELEAETYSYDYIKEDYETLGELNIIESGKVIYIKILKGFSTEKIVFMTRTYVSKKPVSTKNKGTYFDIYNQIDFDVHYSSFKSNSSSIIILSGYKDIAKIVGDIDTTSLERSVSVFRERVKPPLNKTFTVKNIVSAVESNEQFKDKELVICGFRIAGEIGVIYVDKYRTSSFLDMVVLKIFMNCILVMGMIVTMLWFIKSNYIDKGVELIHNCLKSIILSSYSEKGDDTSLHTSKFNTINCTKLDELFSDIHILENNVKRRSSKIYQLENKDAKTNLPNENELRKEIERYEQIKMENIYLALFYIQPSEGMNKAALTLMSQVSSIYTQISSEINDILFDFNGKGCGTATLYRTSSETFSVMAITDSKSDFFSLIKHITETITKDRFENNIHFVTPCYCSWMHLDFYSEIKNSYSSKLNRTLEYAVKQNKIVQEFDQDVSSYLKREDELKFDAKDAFENGEFNLLYQPIFSTSKNIMVGVHVYPRWKHNIHGEINYNEFMPILEKLRIGEKAQRWFINESLRELNEWRKSGYRKLGISVRISQIQIASKNFALDLEEIAMEHSVDNEQISILLSPETFESPSESIRKNIENLNRKGFKVVINSYGVPYNTPSLIGLLRFKIDKIILSLDCIKSILKVKKKDGLTSQLSRMCKEFDAVVSCNAVEDIDLARELAKSGVDEISGNCLAKPIEGFSLKSYFDFNIKNRLNI